MSTDLCQFRKESKIILQGGMVRASGLGYTFVSLTLLMFLVFTVYIVTGGELTPKKVFTTLSLLIVLRLTSTHFFVQNVLAVTEGRVAVVRLQVSSMLNVCLFIQKLITMCLIETVCTGGASWSQ